MKLAPEEPRRQKGVPMKIRQLADAALVAALLMAGMPSEVHPVDPPVPCIIPADPAEEEIPASREPS